MTYEDLIKDWKSSSKKITYKNQSIWVRALKRDKDKKVFYIGTYYPYKFNGKFSSTFETIHYDKVISKFEKFVDEYCTDWQPRAMFKYKDYLVKIDKEKDKEFYLGTVQFHKNSTFKHIANTKEEVEIHCRNRIGQVLKHKQGIKKMESKEYRVEQLEAQIARLQQEIEKVRKEETFTYKRVILELTLEKDNWFNGVIKNAPKNTCTFYGDDTGIIKRDFQRYIDELEESTNIYLTLTGQEIAKRES